MSSAAKLRYRGIALAGATALVMTSFGPAAFAWNALPTDGDPVTPGAQTVDSSDDAGAASIGLVDKDTTKPGTQGATALTPGGNGEIGDVKFVLPATWQAGDTLDLQIGSLTPGVVADRVSFTSPGAVTFDQQAYNFKTHVADYSPTYTAGAEQSSATAAGSTEGGTLTKYAPDGTTTTTARTPQFGVSMVKKGTGTASFSDTIRITFTNDSDPASNTAKFIGTLTGAKVDVGTNVSGAVPLTASFTNGSGNGTTAPTFYGDASSARNVTYPAMVSQAAMAVENASVVADGSQQNVGPISVTGTKDFTTGQAVTVTLAGQNTNGQPVAVPFAGTVTVTQMDSAGKVLGTSTINATSPTLTVDALAGARKVVFSGVQVKAPEAAASLTYTLAAAGGLDAPTTPLGGSSADRHQLDIEGAVNQTITSGTASSLPTRLGGQDRYQTAVKIAEQALGTDSNGPRGESDNVVIASGEGFADALSSGYLAATKDAQLILTRAGSLPQTDIEFLKTYGAKNIFIVGGNGSVSKTVEDQLKSLQSYDVQAKEQTQQVTRTVHNGSLPTTATAGGVSATLSPQLAYTNQASAPGALVLTVARDVNGNATNITTSSAGYAVTGYSGNTATVTFTRPDGSTQTSTVTVAGGSSTVSADDTYTFTPADTTSNVTTTEPVPGGPTDQTAQGDSRKVVPLDAKLTVTRLAGSDRFQTNRKVNEYAGATSVNPIGQTIPEFGKPYAKTAMVVNGMAPWDALAAGPLVSKTGSTVTKFPLPVILTAGDSLNVNAKTQLQTLDVQRAIFIGGAGVLPDSLMGEADNLGAYTNRLAGADRWGTAKAVAEFALASDVASSTNKFPGLNFQAVKTNPILANGGSINGNMASTLARGAWADALAAGPLAAKESRIIALTDSTSLPGTTKDLLSQNKAAFDVPVIAVGLGGVISTETIAAANAAIAK
ncbi:cell wall-binding repeat-containing protein [Mobilicoccus massiliensis]|uniref:cell wall-binding repeat-containing protein n=1 Tax=Mobilicoccus massiliensis TaxID=1522310 RepID=UPI00058B2EA1|nr:cell wall-binding repeat-containing protein [Mobilicoccus massiliensis]